MSISIMSFTTVTDGREGWTLIDAKSLAAADQLLAELYEGNMEMNFHFLDFRRTEMAQQVEMPPHGRKPGIRLTFIFNTMASTGPGSRGSHGSHGIVWLQPQLCWTRATVTHGVYMT